MSISDLIIVMKDGIIQQIGKPQEVYDEPVNLFVAQFLGTPAINVLEGELRGGKLYLGQEAVLDLPGKKDGPVWVGIRPEGFVLDENGPFTCGLDRVEVMGRDVSVVCTHGKMTGRNMRAIIPAESRVDTGKKTVRFSLKPYKVYVFDRESEARR